MDFLDRIEHEMDAENCGSWTLSPLYGSVEEQKPVMSEIMNHK
jgi:hypothetical protein